MVKKILLIGLVCIGVTAFMASQVSAGCCCNPRFCASWLRKGVQADLSYAGDAVGEDVEIRVFGTQECGELTGTLFCAPVNGNGGVEVLTNNPTNSTADNELECKKGFSAARVIVIDEDSIDNGTPPNFFKAEDVNDDLAKVGQRHQLRFFAHAAAAEDPADARITLYTGKVRNYRHYRGYRDYGWFALTYIPKSWAWGGPSDDGLRNYVGVMQPDGKIEVGSGLGSGIFPQWKLTVVPGVTPLRGTALDDLVGEQVCAVVYDRDIKLYHKSRYARLRGANLGRVAFKVLAVEQLGSSPYSKVDIEILDADRVCEGELYIDAPEGQEGVCAEEPDVTVPFEDSLVAQGTFEEGDCNAQGCTKTLIANLDPADGQAACDAEFGEGETEFVDFVPNEFYGQATSTAAEDNLIIDFCTASPDGGNRYDCVPANLEDIPTCEPEPVPECEGKTCADFEPCNVPQPEGGCTAPVCVSTTEELGFCTEGTTPCAGLTPCTSSSDCGNVEGESQFCAILTCCTFPDPTAGVCIPESAFCPPAVVVEAAAPKAVKPKAAAPEAGPTIGGF